jgi:hypothetical protein
VALFALAVSLSPLTLLLYQNFLKKKRWNIALKMGRINEYLCASCQLTNFSARGIMEFSGRAETQGPSAPRFKQGVRNYHHYKTEGK